MKSSRYPWTQCLSEEDLNFIKRFVLVSGSLKEVAKVYGISYPTVRLRLDRLIEKIKIADDSQIQSDFERTLRSLVVDGKLDSGTFRVLLETHRKEVESYDTSNDSDN